MAEALFRHAVEQAGIRGWEIASAGTLGLWNRAAAPEAIEALREVGLDLERHRSRGVVVEEIVGSDWIVAMAQEHLGYLEHLCVEASSRTRLVRAFEDGEQPLTDAPDLDDPIGESIVIYRLQRELLTRATHNLVAFLRRSA